MKFRERLSVETDLISGILAFLIISILFYAGWVACPEINFWTFLSIFIALFLITFTAFKIYNSMNPKVFSVVKNIGKKDLLDRTFKTPLFSSFIGIMVVIIYTFFNNKYIFALNLGILVYTLLSLIELIRFIYYIEIETKNLSTKN